MAIGSPALAALVASYARALRRGRMSRARDSTGSTIPPHQYHPGTAYPHTLAQYRLPRYARSVPCTFARSVPDIASTLVGCYEHIAKSNANHPPVWYKAYGKRDRFHLISHLRGNALQ
eukprot:3204262-Rhodomonas_salina.1